MFQMILGPIRLLGAFVVAVLALTAVAPARDAAVLPIDPDGVQRQLVILDSYSYKPDHLIIHAGVPVELMLKNVAFITPHNFIIDEPKAGLVIEADVGAGDSQLVRFTAPSPGLYPFYCDKKLLFFKSHREKGMEGVLEVRE